MQYLKFDFDLNFFMLPLNDSKKKKIFFHIHIHLTKLFKNKKYNKNNVYRTSILEKMDAIIKYIYINY